jgi:nucleotide-binding universal stress UspA family protein
MGYDGILYEQIEQESREVLRKLTWRAKVAGGTVVATHLRLGGVAEEVVGLAEEIGAGVIVMGSRGRGGLRRALMGSVSGSLVRHAPCPVLVVRPDKGAYGRPRLLRRLSMVRSEAPE